VQQRPAKAANDLYGARDYARLISSHPRNPARQQREEPMTSLEILLLINACTKLVDAFERLFRASQQP